MRDLRPYICTFENCTKPDRLHQSRYDWSNHEVDFHRREWFCNWCLETCPTRAEFKDHLSASHTGICGAELEVVVERCERAIQSAQPCPICNGLFFPRQLQSHLGRHLQQLAIFALPIPEESDDEGEDECEGSETESVLGSFHSNPDQSPVVTDTLENGSQSIEKEIPASVKGTQSYEVDDSRNSQSDLPSISDPTAPSSSIPHGLDSDHWPPDRTEVPSPRPSGHQEINTADIQPVPSAKSGETGGAEHNPPLVTKEQCLAIFERFIDTEKPGIRKFYPNQDSLAVKATEGIAIIDRFVREGCSVGGATDLVLLTLYDVVLLTGFTRSSPFNIR